MMESIIISIAAWFIGCQIYNKDFQLLTGWYNYRINLVQTITYIATLIIILAIICDCERIGLQLELGLAGLVVAAISEYFLSRVQSSSAGLNNGVRIAIVSVVAAGLTFWGHFVYLPFFLMGWYVRNVKFGVPHRNSLVLAKLLKRSMKKKPCEEVVVDIPAGIPNFSHAGNHQGRKVQLPEYNLSEYGILPDTKEDLTDKVQRLIDEIGEQGGGTLFFPKGKYLFNKSGKKQFLQINHSNITIEGETDSKGCPLTELVNCGSLINGEKYPWLSPFFITTGEQIQESNMFFGLQFRKRKEMVMRSGSMTDPGSDGIILTPDLASLVTRGSKKGEDVIYVKDAWKIGKYIMLGMYNTDKEASLLKDILGQDSIRPEWQAASRAGDEEAPSFQWLVEVKEVIDDHTIRLVQPLWRDCDMCYEPAVFNVPMLENISIRNLKLSSTWNGLFRHHGHKRYFSVAQAQEMDYGWNGINMKRVAHGNIDNVIFKNFTNPLYVMDSRNVSCEHLVFKGHDGHQGIKVYEHSCDNLFRDVVFYNHYADMMGGEGNAYGNVFTDIKYLNPCFKPVDYDFHGFSEGPMSPPSYNLFENVYGFAHIGSSGSEHMMPSCARENVWWNCTCEGEKKGSLLFRQRYHPKLTVKDILLIVRNVTISCMKSRKLTWGAISQTYHNERKNYYYRWIMPLSDLSKFYTHFYLFGVQSISDLTQMEHGLIHYYEINKVCLPKSLFLKQRAECNHTNVK